MKQFINKSVKTVHPPEHSKHLRHHSQDCFTLFVILSTAAKLDSILRSFFKRSIMDHLSSNCYILQQSSLKFCFEHPKDLGYVSALYKQGPL